MSEGPPRRGVRAPRLLPLILLLALLAGPLASAHATLQSAVPPPNGRGELGQTSVELRFTEEVLEDYTDAKVVDFDGESVNAGPWTYGGARNVLVLPVQPLADGIYSASWQALSVDSHTTRGSFLFSVGNATLQGVSREDAGGGSPETPWDAIAREGVARAIFYGGLFLVLGIPLFVLAVERGGTLPRGLLGTAALFGALGSAAALLSLLLFAERTMLPMGVAAGTDAGSSFVWRAGLLGAASLACLGALLLPPARRRLPVLLAVGLGAGALLATSLGSHAAADKDLSLLSVSLDALHLAMGAVWVGGIVAFLHVVWGRDARAVGELVHRFSPLAVASVVVLLATGTYASWRHIPRVSALWEDDYGRLVSFKVMLLGGLVLLGAYNKSVLGPRLQQGTASPRFFRRVLQAEAVLMVLMLSAAGILASTSPPERDVATGTQGPPRVLELESFTSHSHVILMVSPNPVQVGLQRLVVLVHPGPTSPVAVNDTAEVYLKVAAPGEPEPETTLEPPAAKVARGEWEVEGGLFTSPGTWTVYVLVQRPEVGEFSKVRFEVPVVAREAAPAPTTS